MLIVDNVLLSPVRGLLWIFREIHQAAEQELKNESDAITAKLSELYMKLELGQITEEQFDEYERELLDRLEELEAEEDASAEDEDGDDWDDQEEQDEEDEENEEVAEDEDKEEKDLS